MERWEAILLSVVLLVALVVVFTFVTTGITKYTGYVITQDEGGKCLEDKVTLFVNSLDQLSKISLKNYLVNIKIVDCSKDNSLCASNRVKDFPSWLINGNSVSGDINKGQLENLSGCKL